MYDGYRHFLFILPALFAISGIALQEAADRIRKPLLFVALAAAVLMPGVLGILSLHPYEYVYYNALAGGTAGAFRVYELDYWLTCYKEAVGQLATATTGASRLFVHREPQIAAYYADAGIEIMDLRVDGSDLLPGDYVLVSTEAMTTYASCGAPRSS
jgi:hypothetical protein